MKQKKLNEAYVLNDIVRVIGMLPISKDSKVLKVRDKLLVKTFKKIRNSN